MPAYKTLLILLSLVLSTCTAPLVAPPVIIQNVGEMPSPSPTSAPPPSVTLAPATATARPSPLPSPTLTPQPTATPAKVRTLGLSSGGNPIEVYHYGQGPAAIVMIGGIHGGYEWNTILLAYEMIDYFEQSPADVPPGFSIYIIPAANPDGLAALIGHTGRFSAKEIPSITLPGRFDANGVDINRNWDCKWQPEGQWRDEKIDAGTAPFSEPETRILRDFLIGLPAEAVIWWHSAMPGIFAGGCQGDFPAALTLAKIYADGSGYPFQKNFVSYSVTGDASDWLSLEGIPSISVELSTHENTDFKRNLGGVLAALEMFTPEMSPVPSSSPPILTPVK